MVSKDKLQGRENMIRINALGILFAFINIVLWVGIIVFLVRFIKFRHRKREEENESL